jgi:hypothetical protein
MATTEQTAALPTAQELMQKLAEAEAAKASEAVRRNAAADAEKRALLEHMTQPSGVSDDEAMRRVGTIVERAISNGLTEVQVYRFPNQLCTDRGRAITQAEDGWPETLTGVPKEIYKFYERQLQPRGYKIRFEIVDWPGGYPGDVGVTLKWA